MLADPIEHMRHSNDQTFLVLQIEDREALNSVEEIAATDGVDMLFIGIGDLSISLGVPMQFDNPLVQHARLSNMQLIAWPARLRRLGNGGACPRDRWNRRNLL